MLLLLLLLLLPPAAYSHTGVCCAGGAQGVGGEDLVKGNDVLGATQVASGAEDEDVVGEPPQPQQQDMGRKEGAAAATGNPQVVTP